MKDLRHVRFVTQNYHALQGLRILPFAIWLFILAVFSGLWRNPPLVVVLVACNVGLIIAALFSSFVKNYYEHHFGKVDPKPKEQQQVRVEQIAGCMSGFILWMLPVVFQGRNTSSLTLILSVTGAYFITLYFRKDWRGRGRYVIIPVVMLTVGMLPFLFGFPVDNYLATPFAFAFFVISLGLILHGVFDHLHLAGTFQPVMGDENGEII